MNGREMLFTKTKIREMLKMKAIIRLVRAHGENDVLSKEVEIEKVDDMTVSELMEVLKTETYAHDTLEIQFLDYK